MSKVELIILILALFMLSTCKKEEKKDIQISDMSYFPLVYNSENIYLVTETTIDKPMNIDSTTQYQLKIHIDTCYIDNSGNVAWRIERYKRTIPNSIWIITDVWVAQIKNNQAQTVEENNRFIKMVFPIKEDKKWNGNAYNTLGEQEYYYQDHDVIKIINGTNFDSTTTIVQNNFTSMISKNYSDECYARNVGLVSKTIINIEQADIIYTTQGVLLPIEQRVKRGSFYYQIIIY